MHLRLILYCKAKEIPSETFRSIFWHLGISCDRKIRNILISDLELFLIKGASCEENETSFLYKGVSYMREPTVLND